MIKRLGIVILLLLAINFLGVAGGVAYLIGTGKLDKDRAKAIGKIVFPDPLPTSQPATQPTTAPSSDPLFQIDELLNKQAGKTAAEQVQVVRDAYEKLAAQLDRQRREVIDLRRQVDGAQAQVVTDRASIAAREKAFADAVAKRAKLNQEEGFKATLAIFDETPTAQLKDMLASMDDPTVVRYLQAMEPRRVSRIVKEFTSPAEQARAQRWLSLMSANADDIGAGPRDAGSAPNGTQMTTPVAAQRLAPPTPPAGR